MLKGIALASNVMSTHDTRYYQAHWAAELGFEPRYWDPKSHVLPLDDSAIVEHGYYIIGTPERIVFYLLCSVLEKRP